MMKQFAIFYSVSESKRNRNWQRTSTSVESVIITASNKTEAKEIFYSKTPKNFVEIVSIDKL